MKPWRDAVKAEQAAIKANADFLYKKALLDDPNLATSNPLSRYLHKKRIQRDYAKRVRRAEKTAKNTEAAASSAAERVKEAVQEAAAFIKSHWKGVLIVGGIASVIVIMFGGVSSCSAMIGSGVSGVFTSSYLSDDEDMLLRRRHTALWRRSFKRSWTTMRRCILGTTNTVSIWT